MANVGSSEYGEQCVLTYYYSLPVGLLKMNKGAMAKCVTEQLMVRVAATTENTAEINAAAPGLLSTTAYNSNNELLILLHY